MSFRYKFIFSFIAIEAIFLIIIVLFNIKMLEQQSQQLIEKNIDITNTLFIDNIKSSLINNDLESLDDSTLKLSNIKGILYVRVLDESGDTLSESTSPDMMNNKKTIKSIKQSITLFESTTQQLKNNEKLDQRNTYSITIGNRNLLIIDQEVKLKYFGASATYMQYVYDASESNIMIANAKKISFLLIVMELMISAAIAAFLGFNITRSLNNLTRAAHKIANNEPAIMPEQHEGHDEISQLSNAMYHMQKQIIANTRQLKQTQQKALVASKAKSEFLAVMSHEIRTPLNGMIGSLNLINTDHLNHEDAECIEMVRNSSDILITVINDILDFSKIEAGKFSLDQHAIHIKQLLDNIDDFYRPLVEKKGLNFNIKRENLEGVFIKGDVIRIKQIINNFINNAIKFTEKGSITLFATRTEKNTLAFDIIDTGIGIHEEDIQNLFKDFSQLNIGNNRKYGGTGLGLAISKRLANLMNGDTYASSEYGQGSTFSVELALPIITEAEYQKEHDQIDRRYENISRNLSAKVLLVEDNRTNQMIAKRLLEKTGCDVTIANNGVESIEKLQNEDFDIVLMDCQMPVMDGFEATMKIRRSGNNIPIIALTANVQETDKKACFQAGMTDFLSKPFKPSILYQKIQANLISVY